MSNLFLTGLSGLQSFQRALDATSQNIANSHTAGYVRQRIDFVTRDSNLVGDVWVGTGVAVGGMRRVVNDFLTDQSRSAQSAAARSEVFAGQTARIANLLGSATGGLSASLQRLHNAIEGVAAEPASIASRQVLLGELQGTVAQLRSADSRLREFETEINGQITTEITAIDGLASSLAGINRDIVAASVSSGDVPHELMDERDRLLDELAAKVSMRFVANRDGSVDVFVGQGQQLVFGAVAARIDTRPDPADGTRQRVVLRVDGNVTDITNSMTGGTLGGLQESRAQVLDSTRNEIGRIATVLTASLNAQNAKGIDLAGAPGGAMLAVVPSEAVVPSSNKGAVTAALTLTDPRALSGADYELQWSGSGWAARRLDTGGTVAMSGDGSAVAPFSFDGLSVVLGGAPAVSDRVLLRPTREAVHAMTVEVLVPARIAAALPVRASAANGNAGTGAVSSIEVHDPSHPDLRDAVTVSFPTPGTVSIDGGAPQAWTSGQTIDRNGWRLRLTGAPAAGDLFTISDNGAGRGDNRNAVLLAETLRGPLLDSGTVSLVDAATRLVSGIGNIAQQAQRNQDMQRLVFQESFRQRQSISGVNLDEEAANLLRYQQAYQASAQVIRAANEVFRMLIDIVR
jgi:flagellar hook-associated protein 1 FlgK